MMMILPERQCAGMLFQEEAECLVLYRPRNSSGFSTFWSKLSWWKGMWQRGSKENYQTNKDEIYDKHGFIFGIWPVWKITSDWQYSCVAIYIEKLSHISEQLIWWHFMTMAKFTLEASPLMSQRGSEESAELPARFVPEMSREESLRMVTMVMMMMTMIVVMKMLIAIFVSKMSREGSLRMEMMMMVVMTMAMMVMMMMEGDDGDVGDADDWWDWLGKCEDDALEEVRRLPKETPRLTALAKQRWRYEVMISWWYDGMMIWEYEVMRRRNTWDMSRWRSSLSCTSDSSDCSTSCETKSLIAIGIKVGIVEDIWRQWW